MIATQDHQENSLKIEDQKGMPLKKRYGNTTSCPASPSNNRMIVRKKKRFPPADSLFTPTSPTRSSLLKQNVKFVNNSVEMANTNIMMNSARGFWNNNSSSITRCLNMPQLGAETVGRVKCRTRNTHFFNQTNHFQTSKGSTAVEIKSQMMDQYNTYVTKSFGE